MTAEPATRPRPQGPRRIVSVVVRVAVVALVLVAEVTVMRGAELEPANHFSYFTILSNVFGAVVMAAALVRPVPDALRGAAVAYLMLTGIVYTTMLRGVDVQTPDFANVALHVLVPVLMVVDWLVAPPTSRLTLRHVLLWMVAPLGYLAYSLVRGPIVDWYPYPFLDPRPDGYGTVVIGSLTVAVAFLAASLFVAWVGNRIGTARRPVTPAQH